MPLDLNTERIFPAGVTGVKFVHDVAERGKIVIAFQTVHTVIDGDQAGHRAAAKSP